MNPAQILLLILSALLWTLPVAAQTAGPHAAVAQARLPAGFQLSLYTDQTPDARSLTLGDDGTLYVGTRDQGKVYAVRDNDGDGRGEQVITLATGLNYPNGVAFYRGALYVAEVQRLLRYDAVGADLAHPPRPVVVYEQLPHDIHHGSRYLRVGPDGKLYLGIGMPCNSCLPRREVYGSLLRLDPDGAPVEIIAQGIRNTVGFDWQPETGALFFTDNGRDGLGDDLPPDELNRLDKPGQHFGFPYCHGGLVADLQFGQGKTCRDFTPPLWRFPAHVAPLGLRFYTGTSFPAAYRRQLFVVQHGSWNRSRPQGYQVVLVRLVQGNPVSDSVFVDGWLSRDGNALARPVDILLMPDGSLLVSDDMNGAVYRIRYTGDDISRP